MGINEVTLLEIGILISISKSSKESLHGILTLTFRATISP